MSSNFTGFHNLPLIAIWMSSYWYKLDMLTYWYKLDLLIHAAGIGPWPSSFKEESMLNLP